MENQIVLHLLKGYMQLIYNMLIPYVLVLSRSGPYPYYVVNSG